MRRFDVAYLRHTRRGMWEDSRDALRDLALSTRRTILDVGCGTGGLTRVLAEEAPAGSAIVGCDVDRDLLEHSPGGGHGRSAAVIGEATRLPIADDAVDLAVCQALLINVENPLGIVAEFVRVSSDVVGAVEPNNAEVAVTSTVSDEPAVDRRARVHYMSGLETDVAIGGPGVKRLFRAAGLEGITTRRYVHERTIAPPYAEHELLDARRKATGADFDRKRSTLLSGDLSAEEFDDLKQAWRDVGHEAIDQMRHGTYRRRERVPYYVTVGRSG